MIRPAVARVRGWLVAAVLASLAACTAHESGPRQDLGLFTTLPIYWAESGSIDEALNDNVAPHWARTALEGEWRLVPLDTIDERALAPLHDLVIAQPRPLSPEENVALDDWVRAGGRVLLFADPLLTAETRFAPGDRRRPQDVALLSPILRHWGLELTYDDRQPAGERSVAAAGISIPVDSAGALRRAADGGTAACTISAAGVVADCRLGQGRVVIVADAALLDPARAPAFGEPPLLALIGRAFTD